MLKLDILVAAVTLARKIGLQNLTREAVAKAANAGESTINYHYGSMDLLRSEVVEHALLGKDISILTHAWIEQHPKVYKKIPEALAKRIFTHIIQS
jgi:AcrR family transcriptional regulator